MPTLKMNQVNQVRTLWGTVKEKHCQYRWRNLALEEWQSEGGTKCAPFAVVKIERHYVLEPELTLTERSQGGQVLLLSPARWTFLGHTSRLCRAEAVNSGAWALWLMIDERQSPKVSRDGKTQMANSGVCSMLNRCCSIVTKAFPGFHALSTPRFSDDAPSMQSTSLILWLIHVLTAFKVEKVKKKEHDVFLMGPDLLNFVPSVCDAFKAWSLNIQSGLIMASTLENIIPTKYLLPSSDYRLSLAVVAASETISNGDHVSTKYSYTRCRSYLQKYLSHLDSFSMPAGICYKDTVVFNHDAHPGLSRTEIFTPLEHHEL